MQVKNESRFSKEKNSLHTEFNADCEYVILFEKIFLGKTWPYRYLSISDRKKTIFGDVYGTKLFTLDSLVIFSLEED